MTATARRTRAQRAADNQLYVRVLLAYRQPELYAALTRADTLPCGPHCRHLPHWAREAAPTGTRS